MHVLHAEFHLNTAIRDLLTECAHLWQQQGGCVGVDEQHRVPAYMLEVVIQYSHNWMRPNQPPDTTAHVATDEKEDEGAGDPLYPQKQ